MKIHFEKFLLAKKAVIVCHSLAEIEKVRTKLEEYLDREVTLAKLPPKNVLTKLQSYCVANNAYTGTYDYYCCQKDVKKYDFKQIIFNDIYFRVSLDHRNVSLYKGTELLERVKCDKEDKFDYEVGAGLCLKRYFKKHKEDYSAILEELKLLDSLTDDYSLKAKWLYRKTFGKKDNNVLEKLSSKEKNFVIENF